MCLLDLDYNLPVQVRDSATGKELEDLPESDVNKEYVLQRLAEDGDLDSSYNKQRADDTILKLQRTTPYYKVSWVPDSLVQALEQHLDVQFFISQDAPSNFTCAAEEQGSYLQFLCQGRM